MKSGANRSFYPRLSEATQLLPLIRRHLFAVASRRPLATALQLVPIVEEGLFGYELIPDRETYACPILGCNAEGEPALRNTSYGVGTPDALQLVAVNGRLLSRSERAARYTAQRREFLFSDWLAAAEAAWEQFFVLFPDLPRRTPILRENMHRNFDRALSVAHSHLLRWDPIIQFFGLPDEAQMGFNLIGAGGEHGQLTFQQPDVWTLHWNAPPQVIKETWSLALDDHDSGHKADGDPGFSAPRQQTRRGKDRRKTRGRRATDQDDS